MAVLPVHPLAVKGPWVEGFALDKHTIKSVPLGTDDFGNTRFDTTRTPLGERVFQFKNRRGAADDIVETAVDFIRRQWPNEIECVICPPPSVTRFRQPAELLAERIARVLGVPAPRAVVVKTAATGPMKNSPRSERAAILAAAIKPRHPSAIDGRRVLLVDDLWETGSTMRVVAEIVRSMGAAEIRVLAMTYTKQT